MQSLAEAIRAKDSKEIHRYGHKLKGAARHMCAVRLSEKAACIEQAGRDEDINTAASHFGDIQGEFEKFLFYLSQENWMEIAKQQTKSQTETIRTGS